MADSRQPRTPRVVDKVKLVLVGDMEVGKTCLALRFANSTFDDNQTSTIGASFLAKAVDTQDRTVVFHIWDTAGQERFHSLIPMYLREARVAIVLYDITDEISFKSVKDVWIPKLRRDGTEKLRVVIVGSKSDLTSLRQVDTQRGEQLAQRNRCLFREVSSKTGANVDDLFQDIANSVGNTETQSDRFQRHLTIHLHDDATDNQENKGQKKCCGLF